MTIKERWGALRVEPTIKWDEGIIFLPRTSARGDDIPLESSACRQQDFTASITDEDIKGPQFERGTKYKALGANRHDDNSG